KCLIVVAREEEVHREQLGMLAVIGPRSLEDRVPDALMQLPSTPVRKTLVGGVSHQGVAEAVVPAALVVDELDQPIPRSTVELVLALEERAEEVGVEAHPEDRCVSKDRPVRRREAV